MTVRRLLGAALTLPVMTGGLLLMTAGPAAACSCAAVRSDAERAARADAVFVGTLVSHVNRVDRSGSGRVVLMFEVSRVYKGAVGVHQEIVTSGNSGSGCGLGVPGPGPFLVFAHRSMGSWVQVDLGQYGSSSCSGSRALAGGGEPALLGGAPPSALGLRDSLVGAGVLAAGVAGGLALATLRARRRASLD